MHSTQLGHGVVEPVALRLTHIDVKSAVEIEVLVGRHQIEILHNAHDIVHCGIFEVEAIAHIDGLLYYLGVGNGIAGSSFVGIGQSRSAEQYTAEVAHHDDERVGEVGGEELPMDGTSAGAGGLAVVVDAVGLLGGAEDVGIAMVTGIEILLAEAFQMLFHLVGAMHREGEGKELAALLLVKPLGGSRYSMIRVVEHRGCQKLLYY